MKTAILLLSISALWGVELRAATVSFSNIPATNVVKATDLLLLDSALGGTNYSTRTLTVSNLANIVAAPVGTVVASGTPASTNTFFAPSDLTGTNAVPRAILAADIATSIVTSKQTNVAAANPTATVSTSAVNGSALTFMRSDAAPAIPASFIQANQTNATLNSLGGVTTNAPNIAAGSIAAFSSSNVLGAATSAQLQSALGNVYQATNGVLTTVAAGGDVVLAKITATKAFQAYQGTLTHAGTITLDFDGTTTANSLVCTGAMTFAAFSNIATNRTYRLLVINNQATNCAITFPSPLDTSVTNWFGGKPAAITAGRSAMWSMEAWGAGVGDVKCAWTETQ